MTAEDPVLKEQAVTGCATKPKVKNLHIGLKASSQHSKAAERSASEASTPSPTVPSASATLDIGKTCETAKPTCIECRGPIESKENGSFGSYAPSLLSAVLVVIGWAVVNKLQANRERRKQIRDYAAGLIKEAADMEKEVIEYHTNIRDTSAEQSIIAKLTRFEKATGVLPKFVASQLFIKAVNENSLKVDPAAIQVMRKAMTLKHFYDEHEDPINHADGLIQDIVSATSQIQDLLEAIRIAALD